MTTEDNETQTTPDTLPENTAPETGQPENAQPEGSREGEQEQKPKHNGIDKRISKLTREKYELKGQLKALQERMSQGGEAPQPKPEDDPEEDPRELIRREAQRVGHELFQLAEASRRKQEIGSAWRKSEAESKKRHEDYDDVVSEFVESGSTPRHVEAAILEADRPAEVTYYLATHPEEAESIAAMSPFRAGIAIGKIEARLAQAPALKKQSAAPEPIAPVKPKGKPQEGLSDDLDSDTWAKRWREKQKTKRASQEWKRA